MGTLEGICIHVLPRRYSITMETVQMHRQRTGVMSRCSIHTLVLVLIVVLGMVLLVLILVHFLVLVILAVVVWILVLLILYLVLIPY